MTERMILPVQTPSSSRWQVQDYDTASSTSAPASAAGRAEVTFTQVPDGELWMIERIVVITTSAAATTAEIYNTSERDDRLREFTPNGNADVADMASPMQLRSGEQLLVVWSGATAGAIATCNLQYTVLRRTVIK